ncbi:hypothetical protein F7725_015649 [Dissostichus mawsoni]|uniref:Uncharacterized protein n=1 Tax=Dissostichus mawsoni TaxID=36200 RepID=A0A7J5YI40_DISMA|nr:hypothetical protein F7725_015649 [Dissostichus mawsoni]
MHFIQEAEVEVGEQGLGEGLPEGVQVCHALCVVEGHQAPLVVQIHPDPDQGFLQGQDGGGGSAGHVLYPIRQGEGPEAVGREGFDDPLPGHRLPGHPHRPHGAAVDFDLPVVSPVGKALAPQQRQGSVEPLVSADLTRSRVKASCSLSLSSISWRAPCRREISTQSSALCSSRRISSLRSSVFSFTCSSFSSWYRNWCRSLNWASMRCFRSAVWSWIMDNWGTGAGAGTLSTPPTSARRGSLPLSSRPWHWTSTSFLSCRVLLLCLASSLPVECGDMKWVVQQQPQPLTSSADRMTSRLSQETKAEYGYSILGMFV